MDILQNDGVLKYWSSLTYVASLCFDVMVFVAGADNIVAINIQVTTQLRRGVGNQIGVDCRDRQSRAGESQPTADSEIRELAGTVIPEDDLV